MPEFRGQLRPTGRVALLVSQFNERVTARLLEGALGCCKDAGVPEQQIDVVWLPGAFELGAAAAAAAETGRYAAIVGLGAVVRGETPHFEYVAGETLAQLIRRRGVGRMWERLAILEDLCVGLHYAHAAGIVHRDIKPANVMRDSTGMLKILDFGIARAAGGGLTREGDVVGTLNYMSPEQLAGETVDHRTDIYSVGALGYELITTQMAFPGTVQTGVLFKILNGEPVPIETLVPGIDADVSAAINRAMAKAPEARYQDLERMREDLSRVRIRLLETDPGDEEPADPNAETRFESGRISSVSSMRPSSRVISGRHGTAAPAVDPQSEAGARRSSKTRVWGSAAALLIVAIAAGAIYVNQSRQSRPLPQPPASVSAPQVQPPAPPPASPAVATPPPASEARDAMTPTPPPRSETVVPAPETNVPSAASPGDPVREVRLIGMRTAARQQLAIGREDGALEAALGGLALDPKDRALNQLLADLARSARERATRARDSATRAGSRAESTASFREGKARESEATRLMQAGDRASGIRAFWSAAALYDQASKTTEIPANPSALSSSPKPAPEAAARPPVVPIDPTPPPPPPEPIKPAAPPVEKAPPPPPPSKVEPSVPGRDAKDTTAVDVASVREVLRQYVRTYQALDTAAVGAVMPSLSADQLRNLERDFSSYRSYSVVIKDESIAIDGNSARVTCQVVRSFETKSGVSGSNTLRTVFHLRRAGSGWTIDRLESR